MTKEELGWIYGLNYPGFHKARVAAREMCY